MDFVGELRERGYVLLKDLLSAEELTRLRTETDRLETLMRPGMPGTLYLRRGWFGPKRLSVIYHVYRHSPLIARLFYHPVVHGFVASMLGAAPAYAGGMYMDKKPGVRHEISWHQDTGFHVDPSAPGPLELYPPAGIPYQTVDDAVASRILALQWNLDDQDEGNGCLRVRPGTHRLGRLSPEGVAKALREVPEAVMTMPSGSCVIYFPHLLHASYVNRSAGRRRRVLRFIYRTRDLAKGQVPWHDFQYPPAPEPSVQ